MAIATLAAYQNSCRQQLIYRKSAVSYGSVGWTSLARVGGDPPSTGSPGDTTSGVIPTSASTGFLPINPFSGAAYITSVEASLRSNNTAFGGFRWLLADLLWYAGAFSQASNYTLSAQPDFSSRLPGGSYVGLQLWSGGASGSGNPANVTVTYTNENGTAARTSGTIDVDAGGSNVGLQASQFPLQAGDCGIQKVESITGAGGTTIAYDLMILRPLAWGRVHSWQATERQWLDRTQAPVIYQDSALLMLEICPGSSDAGILTTPPLEFVIEVAAA